MASIFSRQKPDFTRLEQKEPPEEDLPELPELPRERETVLSPAEIERRIALGQHNVIQPPVIENKNKITPQEKIALFEWHWARAIELYQELKNL